MSTAGTKKSVDSKKAVEYNSNPFTLSFGALGRFFNFNANWAIAILVLGIIGFFGQITGNAFQALSQPENNSGYTTKPLSEQNIDPTIIIAIAIVVFVIVLIAIIVGTVISTFVSGMFSYVALKSEEEKRIGFSEALSETTKRFWRLFGAQLLANLKIFAWTLLFIIPGIIAGYRYQLLPYLIMSESEKERGIGDSHTKTKRLIKGRLWEVFGLSTVAGIVPFVGSLLGLSGKAALYRQLKATEVNPETRPKVHWLNYLGILLLIGFLLLAAMIAGIIALVANSTITTALN